MRLNGSFKDDFMVQEGSHQGLVLNPLLIIIALQTLSREMRSRYSKELLYADDLLLVEE